MFFLFIYLELDIFLFKRIKNYKSTLISRFSLDTHSDFAKNLFIRAEIDCKKWLQFSLNLTFALFTYRCYSALGDIAKARYMKETFRIAEDVQKQHVSIFKVCWTNILNFVSNVVNKLVSIYIYKRKNVWFFSVNLIDLMLILFTFKGGDGFNHYKVRARFAVMEKKYKEAESIYLEQVYWLCFVLLLMKTWWHHINLMLNNAQRKYTEALKGSHFLE